MNRVQGWIALLVLALAGVAAAQETPAVVGVITDTGTSSSFQVNGVDVICSAKTTTVLFAGFTGSVLDGCLDRVLGQSVTVFGDRQKHTHAIEAREIDKQVSEKRERKAEGYAIIDALLPGGAAGERVVRADGYAIRLTPKTRAEYATPLRSVADVGTNVWIRYSGRQQVDGSVVAETAAFSANATGKLEQKLSQKEEYDPSMVKEQDAQRAWDRVLRGHDPKKIPAWHDAAMQTRVDALGARLVPAYERALPAGSGGKLQFRFQVVDLPKTPDALTLSNGLVLVPYQVAEKLGNDDQLATVLADNIAGDLEKQVVRLIPQSQKLAAVNVAGAVAGAFVPGVGLIGIGTAAEASHMVQAAEEQRERVSLELLNDAGFDIREAPKAWWLLNSKQSDPKKLAKTRMPSRTLYLYSVLATNWFAHDAVLGSAGSLNAAAQAAGPSAGGAGAPGLRPVAK